MPIRRAFILYYPVLALWWFSPFLDASAVLVNVTVDDASSNISYGPPLQWSEGADCVGCLARPDKSQAVLGTWHDATFPGGGGAGDLRTASLSFQGSFVPVHFQPSVLIVTRVCYLCVLHHHTFI